MNVEGHSVVMFDNFIYVFGGYDLDDKKETNRLYRIDLTDVQRGLTAERGGAGTTSAGPVGKAMAKGSEFMHIAVASSSGNDDQQHTTFATPYRSHVASSDDVLMYPVATTGPSPSPRAFHACSTRGPYMIVWGGSRGSDESSGLLNPLPVESAPSSGAHRQPFQSGLSSLDFTELFALNLETLVWTRYCVASIAPGVKQQHVPQERCHASLVSSEDALMLYGGYPTTVQEGEESLAFAPNEWRVFRVTGDGLCDAQEPAGAAPTLWGHSTIYAHRCILAFGGIDGLSNEEVNSLCVYHVDERKWRWAEFPEGPCARALHCAVFDPLQNAMIVYGGFTSSADEDHDNDDATANRNGGGNPLVTQLHDVWSFSLETGLWEKLCPSSQRLASFEKSQRPPPSVVPPGRSGHAAVYHEHRMVVIGGLVEQSRYASCDASWLHSKGKAAMRSAASSHGGLVIFDLQTRQWHVKNLLIAKSNSPTNHPEANRDINAKWGSRNDDLGRQEVPPSQEEQKQTRDSIIDKYLNISGPAASPLSHVSISRRQGSGARTVGSHRALAQDVEPQSLTLAGQPEVMTGATLQKALVTSVLHEAAAEGKARRALERTPSFDRWGSGEELGRGGDSKPSHNADVPLDDPTAFSSVAVSSPFSSQRTLTNEMLNVLRTPPRSSSSAFGHAASVPASQDAASSPSRVPMWLSSPAAPAAAASPSTRMHHVVTSIAQKQSDADLRWTTAENERRSKLLMQYLHTHGDANAPWATAISQSGLQDDEVEARGSSLAKAIDPRLVVGSLSVGRSNTHQEPRRGSTPRQESLSFRSPTPDAQRQPELTPVLDTDEVRPYITVYPHPLSPGPWYPLS
jgi:hypothetical protein